MICIQKLSYYRTIKQASLFFILMLLLCTSMVPFERLFAQASDDSGTALEIEKIMKERQIPGLSYAVVKNGETIAMKSFGFRNLEKELAETPNTNHFIASATKTFAGIGLMALVSEGKIDLEDSINDYLLGVHPSWEKVTIRQAISHTSGLPGILDENGDPIGGGDMESAWETIKNRPLQSESGQTWAYSQVGLEVIQRIGYRVSGKSWESHINEVIFKKAGIDNSYWLWSMPATTPNRSVVYEVNDEENGSEIRVYDIVNNFDYYLPAGTGLFTNVLDMAKYARALQNGDLLSPTMLQEMWRSSEFEENPLPWMSGYGIGWILDEYKGHDRVWHSGGGKAIFMHYPDQGLSIIVLTNLADGGVNVFADYLTDRFLNTPTDY